MNSFSPLSPMSISNKAVKEASRKGGRVFPISGKALPTKNGISSAANQMKGFLFPLALLFCSVDMGFASGEIPGGQPAKVKTDFLPVYCQPTPASETVKTLPKGKALIILGELVMPEGIWCRVREERDLEFSGYVLCRNLKYPRAEIPKDTSITEGQAQNSRVSHPAETSQTLPSSGSAKSSYSDPTPGTFLQALWEGDAAKVDEMLQGGIDPNLSTPFGGGPLIISAKKKNPEILRLLIARGASLESRDPNETTPLIAAVSAGLEENVEILIAAGADLNARDITGLTALSWASLKSFPKIVETLISRGADLGAKSKDGRTALRISKMLLANTQKALAAASSEDLPETLFKLKVKLGNHEKVVEILEKAGGQE
jgi:hypothetical protein